VNRDDISKKLEENREAIRAFGVGRLGIFGSYARAEQERASDIDFLVEFDETTLQNYLKLQDFLDGQFQCPVDPIFAVLVKPRLRPTIFDEVVYAQGS
jgi:uncharacterized protein